LLLPVSGAVIYIYVSSARLTFTRRKKEKGKITKEVEKKERRKKGKEEKKTGRNLLNLYNISHT